MGTKRGKDSARALLSEAIFRGSSLSVLQIDNTILQLNGSLQYYSLSFQLVPSSLTPMTLYDGLMMTDVLSFRYVGFS